MNRLSVRKDVSEVNSKSSMANSKEDIIATLEDASVNVHKDFEMEVVSLKYFALIHAMENESKAKRLKENQLNNAVESLGKRLMASDLTEDEKLIVLKRTIDVVSCNEDAQNVAARYRTWILGGLDKE